MRRKLAHSCTRFPCYLGLEIYNQCKDPMDKTKDCRVGQLTILLSNTLLDQKFRTVLNLKISTKRTWWLLNNDYWQSILLLHFFIHSMPFPSNIIKILRWPQAMAFPRSFVWNLFTIQPNTPQKTNIKSFMNIKNHCQRNSGQKVLSL